VIANTFRKHLAHCRKLLRSPESVKDIQIDLSLALRRLWNGDGILLADNELLAEFIGFVDSVLEYRGQGNQLAGRDTSQILNSLMRQLSSTLSSGKPEASALAEPGLPVVASDREAQLRRALEMLKDQALRLVRGRPSRSYHLTALRQDAWYRLDKYCMHARDPEILRTALKVTKRRSGDPKERAAAIEFLAGTSDDDDLADEVIEALEAAADDPSDRDTQRAAYRAINNLLFADEFDRIIVIGQSDETTGGH